MGSLKKVPNSLVWLTVKAISLELLFQLKMHLNIKKISLPASLEAHRLEPVSETLSWQKHCHPLFFIPPFFYWMKCFSSRRCNPAFHQVSLRADWGGRGDGNPSILPGGERHCTRKVPSPSWARSPEYSEFIVQISKFWPEICTKTHARCWIL